MALLELACTKAFPFAGVGFLVSSLATESSPAILSRAEVRCNQDPGGARDSDLLLVSHFPNHSATSARKATQPDGGKVNK